MLLDYERFQRKSSKKKKRIILLICILAAGSGGYFLVTRVFLRGDPLASLTRTSPEQRLDILWAELVRVTAGHADDAKAESGRKRVVAELLRDCESALKSNPLALRALVYHGYASLYRALEESNFDGQRPYLDQAVISLRRANLLAGRSLKPQIAYMLGRVYYFKREFYYDLAARYLEQALNLGYKGADVFEYLVLINTEWGNTDKCIEYLERASEVRQSELYLFHLAKNYKKLNRDAEASRLVERLTASVKDPDMLRECKFLAGEIYFDQGKYPLAEKTYREVLAADPESAEAHFRLALLYEKSGDYAQYRFELRQTLDKDRGHSGARSRLK